MSKESVPIWLDGKPFHVSSTTKIPVYHSADGKLVHEAENCDVATANLVCESAHKAFQTWSKVSAKERRDIVLKFSKLLIEKGEMFVKSQMEETSATELWAKKNIHLASELVEETACRTTVACGEIPQVASKGSLALVFKVPVGPVLLIAPWNSSVILTSRSLANMLAAGCTVVLKSSEVSPKTQYQLGGLLKECGLPDGVLNIIQTSRDTAPAVTEAIISNKHIRKIEFIGSANVGRIIATMAGKHLKPVLLELGGKGPSIILDDADLEAAAKLCVAGAMLHHGQLCFSTERVIVQEKVAEKVKTLLVQAAQKFTPGTAATKAFAQASQAKLIDAQKQGAKFLIGGTEIVGEASLKPTILTGVTKSMIIKDEEAFGPSLSLYVAKDDAEAVEMANDTQYGLNAAVHSTDMYRALKVAQQLEYGSIHINNMTVHDEPTMPVGGVKGSGWGRTNGNYGINAWLEEKTITVSMEGHMPFV